MMGIVFGLSQLGFMFYMAMRLWGVWAGVAIVAICMLQNSIILLGKE